MEGPAHVRPPDNNSSMVRVSSGWKSNLFSGQRSNETSVLVDGSHEDLNVLSLIKTLEKRQIAEI